MEKEIINVDYNGHKIVADIMPANSKPQVICLHGAGGAERKRYDPIRQLLLENNISSCALDFIGHGETGGKMEDSGLKSRTDQAKLVIEKSNMMSPLNIIAGSMGAYNAIKLTEIYNVNLLVLSAPAVYDKDAYEIPFGEKFSVKIRESQSWDNTDAWEILSKYKGDIIILKGGKDKVIPGEVIEKIYNSCGNAKSKEAITFKEAEHSILGHYFSNHPEDLRMVVDKMVGLMK